jgi:mRNA-degrading endonuclease YafQ of YafQ-DinJ toxin-antitoxin module
MGWRVMFTHEFVAKFKELGYGNRALVKDSINVIVSSEDPAALAHHLERQSYSCSWSHRVRANLIIVFRISKKTLIFLSTGTHSQAYRPESS